MNAERPRDAGRRAAPVDPSGAPAREALHPFGDTVLYRLDGRRRWHFFAVVDELDADGLRALLTAAFTAPPGERRYMAQARARVVGVDVFYDARAHLTPTRGDGLERRLRHAADGLREDLNFNAISVHAVPGLAGRSWRGIGFHSAHGAGTEAWLCAGAPLPVPSGRGLRAVFSRVDADDVPEVQEHLSVLRQAALPGGPLERSWDAEDHREQPEAADLPAPIALRWPRGAACGWGDPPFGDGWTGDVFDYALATAGVFLRSAGVTFDRLTELRVPLSDEAAVRRGLREAVVHPLAGLAKAGTARRLDHQFSIHHTVPTRLGRWCPRDAWDIVERVLLASGVKERFHLAFVAATEPDRLEDALNAGPTGSVLRDALDRSRTEEVWRRQIDRLRTSDAWLNDVLVGRRVDEFPDDWRSAGLVRAVADELRECVRAGAKTRLHGRMEAALSERVVGRLAMDRDEAVDCYLRIRYGSIDPAELLAEDAGLERSVASRTRSGTANPLWFQHRPVGRRTVRRRGSFFE